MTLRPPRLAVFTLPGLDHFMPDLARGLGESGLRDVRFFPFRPAAAAADRVAAELIAAALAWADDPARDTLWFEFCWPPFPSLLAGLEAGGRQVVVRVHRVEVYETDHVARTDWSRVSDLVVVSEDMARCVHEVRPDLDGALRVHVVHNGVDPGRAAPRDGFDRFRVGWCGSLIPRKNPSLALQILHRLRRRDPRYRLHVASSGGDRLTIESLLHQTLVLDLGDSVRFEGRLAREAMPAWHAANGILLSTSLHESFGMAIAEAALAGCDLAVLDHVGAAEFWPPEIRFVDIDDAVARIADAAPDRWRTLATGSFALTRQVAAVARMLDAPRRAPAACAADATPFSAAYWQRRYRAGGHSGAGSRGRLATFKAETLNRLVATAGIASVLELGCGDGQQLALARYPAYVGVEVAGGAIELCRTRFRHDPSKRFLLAGQDDPGTADLALSLDVVFHLVEDAVFHAHMTELFRRARRFVAIHSSDHDALTADRHVRHRAVSAWVARHAPDWRLAEHARNPFPHDPARPDETSFADLRVFARRAEPSTHPRHSEAAE